MNKKILAVIVAIVVIAAAGWLVLANQKNTSNTTNNTVATPQNQNSDTTPDAASGDMITFTNNGFSPQKLTVKKGATVTVKNEASNPVQFSSDPHPTHTNEPELNMAELAPGESGTFTVTKVGTWGYHDHLDHDMTGTLVVTD